MGKVGSSIKPFSSINSLLISSSAQEGNLDGVVL